MQMQAQQTTTVTIEVQNEEIQYLLELIQKAITHTVASTEKDLALQIEKYLEHVLE